MLVLALDTTTHEVVCELAREDAVLVARHATVASFVADCHSVVRDVLADADCRISDLGMLAVVTGPGTSWTGIRVGTTLIKSLAFAAGKPAIGLPLLAFLASELAPSRSRVGVVTRERSGFVATGMFDTTIVPPVPRDAPRVLLDALAAAWVEAAVNPFWYSTESPPAVFGGHLVHVRPREIARGARARAALAYFSAGVAADPHDLRSSYHAGYPT